MTISISAQFRQLPATTSATTISNLSSTTSILHPSHSMHHHHHHHHHASAVLVGGGTTATGAAVNNNGTGGTTTPSMQQPSRAFVARQASVDVSGENGCCLVKALISNLLTFATRSKRKAADLGGGGGGKDAQRTTAGNNNGVCPVPETVTTAPSTAACTLSGTTKKTGLVSFSQTGSAKSTRKAVQSVDTCVSDSFDEQMIDKICKIPRDIDQNEWLAAHVLALFEHVNGISSILSEICTPVTCPVMNFPGNQKAPWIDERGKRHNYAAMRYIDSVMSFCEASRQNQVLFPTKYGTSFSPDFESHCARIVRLLWHCLGHIYSKHWEHIGTLNLRPQFGLVLAHMAKLAKMYNLMQEKELTSLNNTLQLARPASDAITQQQRPLKRGLADDGNNSCAGVTTPTSLNPNTVQGRIQQQQRKQQAQQQQQNGKEQQQQQHQQQDSKSMAAMKSGSWGGNSAAAVMAAAAAQQANCGTGLLTSNCQKYYAQTC